MGLCVSRKSKDALVRDMGAAQRQSLCDAVRGSQGLVQIVGDNVDYTLGVRDGTMANFAVTHHWFLPALYVDRVTIPPSPIEPRDILSVKPEEFQLSDVETYELMGNTITLLGRILVRRMPGCALLPWYLPHFDHIPHPCSAQLSQRSIIVPLTLIPVGEASHQGMLTILRAIIAEVDSVFAEVGVPTGRVLFGGDELTSERAGGAVAALRAETGAVERVHDVIPITELFHETMTFLIAVWDKYYVPGTVADQGTLMHLRHLIDRRNVSKDAKHKVHETEAFLQLTTEAHVVAAFRLFLGTTDDLLPFRMTPAPSPAEVCAVTDMLRMFADKFLTAPHRHVLQPPVVGDVLPSAHEYVNILRRTWVECAVEDDVRAYGTAITHMGMLHLNWKVSVCRRYVVVAFFT